MVKIYNNFLKFSTRTQNKENKVEILICSVLWDLTKKMSICAVRKTSALFKRRLPFLCGYAAHSDTQTQSLLRGGISAHTQQQVCVEHHGPQIVNVCRHYRLPRLHILLLLIIPNRLFGGLGLSCVVHPYIRLENSVSCRTSEINTALAYRHVFLNACRVTRSTYTSVLMFR